MLHELPPIDFRPVPLPLIPAGDAIELPADEGWRMWDAAIAMRDAQENRQ
jgi:hypothetical protein